MPAWGAAPARESACEGGSAPAFAGAAGEGGKAGGGGSGARVRAAGGVASLRGCLRFDSHRGAGTMVQGANRVDVGFRVVVRRRADVACDGADAGVVGRRG